jgi:hypothetical protein
MENRAETSTSRGKKVFFLVVIIAVGLALCAGMKTFVCGKIGERCPCQG